MPQCPLHLNSVQPFPIQTAFLLKFDFFFLKSYLRKQIQKKTWYYINHGITKAGWNACFLPKKSRPA